MAHVNKNYRKLAAGYLFPEIAKRAKIFSEQNPDAKIMRLGIGDTTEPLTPAAIEGLHRGVDKLADVKTYTGYGAEQGNIELRKKLAEEYATRGVHISPHEIIQIDPNEIFVSDGAKSDSANIQDIFSLEDKVAVQDPAYPVYVDSNVIAGRTGEFDKERKQYKGIVYMPCTEENGFFPETPKEKVDLIYLCSPNNPTGAVATKEQLKKFVDYARENKSIIFFDAAYAAYISEGHLPRSIYEIDGAKECAIEINSFSKDNGFTGVRLGWAVVPETLMCEDSNPGELRSFWNARQTRFFNGASNVVQEGGLAALTQNGKDQSVGLVKYYMQNAEKINAALQKLGIKTFGSVNAPYVWMQTPNKMDSWSFFDKLLNEAHVVGTPGVGFGPGGETYFRLSSFGHHENIEMAIQSIEKNLRL